MNEKGYIKFEKLTNHVSYCIIDNIIYLFQGDKILDDELNILFKRLSLLIEDNNIDYINISTSKMEDNKEFYQKLGFTLSYYDVNKLNILFKGKKNKNLYKCYGFMTKKDFFNMINSENKKESDVEVKVIVNSNSGYVSSLLLLFGGIILLCYFCVQGAIYLVK